MKSASATAKESADVGAGPQFVTLGPSSVVIYQTKTTDAKRKAALQAILDDMPPPLKPGQKSAQRILAEIRAGKK